MQKLEADIKLFLDEYVDQEQRQCLDCCMKKFAEQLAVLLDCATDIHVRFFFPQDEFCDDVIECDSLKEDEAFYDEEDCSCDDWECDSFEEEDESFYN